MGLDISVLKEAKFVRPIDQEEWKTGEHWVSVSETNFPERADGVKPGIYSAELSWSFRAGSYSGYNHYRSMLAEAGMGADDQKVWANSRKFRGKPFWEQVEMSDCEGTIGPETSAKLAKDYADPKNRERFEEVVKRQHAGDEEEQEYHMSKYDEWAQAFKDAAENDGLVLFH